jgi:hypothetical protein
MIIETVANQYNTQIGVMTDGSGITKIISSGVRRKLKSWVLDGTSIIYIIIGSTKDISWVSADGSASGTIVTNGWNADWQH